MSRRGGGLARGLAPIVVTQVEQLLASLAAESDVAILLIEQNIAVATAVAEDVAIIDVLQSSGVFDLIDVISDRDATCGGDPGPPACVIDCVSASNDSPDFP